MPAPGRAEFRVCDPLASTVVPSRSKPASLVVLMIAAVVLAVAACSGSDPTPSAGGDTQTAVDAPSTPHPGPGTLAPAGTRATWSGAIGDGIGFSMWLAKQGRFLRGEIIYTRVGEPITLLGTHDPASALYVLREFGTDGRISGTMSFDDPAPGAAIAGRWDELPFTAGFDGLDDRPYVFDPLVRSGHYGYRYPPFAAADDDCCGSVGNLTVSGLGDDAAEIEFENNRGGPSFNQAIFEPTIVPLIGNRAVFEGTAGGVYEDCAFEITVFDGFAFVDHLDGRSNCGFGNAAGIEGPYLLIDPAPGSG